MQLNERTNAQIAVECKLRLYPKSNGVHFILAASIVVKLQDKQA